MQTKFNPRTFFLASILAVAAGCATSRMNWDTAIGHTTYDQAVNELGPPARQEKLANGQTAVEWVAHYYAADTSPGTDSGFYNHAAGFGPTPPAQDYRVSKLRLTFDTNSILTDWSRN